MTAETEDRATAVRRRRAASKAIAEQQAALDGAMRKGNAKDAESSVPAAPVVTKAPPVSRADRKKAAQQLANAQADRDAKVRADTTPLTTLPRDRPLTLHELNLAARARDKEMRNDAREAARAAGKAAFEVLSGRVGPDAKRAKRFRAMGSAEKMMQDAQRRAAAEQTEE